MSPNGKEVWVAHRDDGGVSIIDTATDTVKATIPQVGKTPIRVAVTPDSRRVLITAPNSSEVIVFDAASRKIEKRITVPGGLMAIMAAPDGKRAYVGIIKAGAVGIIDLNTLTLSGTVEGTGPHTDGIAWAS